MTTRKFNIRELDLNMINPNRVNMFHHGQFKDPTKTGEDDPRYNNQGGSKIFVIGRPGMGKCLAQGTPVLMFDGTVKKVEEIKEGELLMGDDSTARTVQSTTSGIDDMFKISQSRGLNYTVNKPHILSIINPFTDKVQDISVEEYLTKPFNFKKDHRGFKRSVSFPTRDVELDPYMLGLWVGSDMQMLKTDSDILGSISNIIANLMECSYQYKFRKRIDKLIYMETLKKMNQINNKHIPEEYKCNSAEVRLQVLRGVVVMNALYDMKKKMFEINIQDEPLINDIIYIARSLGFDAYKKKFVSNRNKTVLKVFIIGDIFSNNIDKYVYTKISITPAGRGKYYGFELDGNGRFMLGDFTVTHNTSLITSILYKKSDIFSAGVVISGSEDSNGHYSKIMPPQFVFDEFTEDIPKNVIKRQKLIIKQYIKDPVESGKQPLTNPWIYFLMDDCMDDPKIFNTKIMRNVIKNGRHYKNLYLLSLQYCLDVKPSTRALIDGVFILHEPQIKVRKSLWENYAGVFDDFTDFCEVMDELTKNYTAIYIRCNYPSSKVEDCVFYYKADLNEIPRDFKMGCQEYWMHAEDRGMEQDYFGI